jgi:hypothetical protein
MWCSEMHPPELARFWTAPLKPILYKNYLTTIIICSSTVIHAKWGPPSWFTLFAIFGKKMRPYLIYLYFSTDIKAWVLLEPEMWTGGRKWLAEQEFGQRGADVEN